MKVTVTDKRSGQEQAESTRLGEPFSFVSRGGLADLVEHLSTGVPVNQIITCSGIDTFTEKVPVNGKMTDVERECRVDVALRWTGGYDTEIVSFVNTIPTSQGGTHQAGFDKALTQAVNNVVFKDNRKLAKLKKEDKHKAVKDDVQKVSSPPSRSPSPNRSSVVRPSRSSVRQRSSRSCVASPTSNSRSGSSPVVARGAT